jgi:hypothetical protein
MAETLMTFYNKIPASAFLKIEGFEAPTNEGPKATASLNRLERFSLRQFDDEQKEFGKIQTHLQQESDSLQSEIDSSSSSRRSGSKVDEKSKELEEKRSYLGSLDFERFKFEKVVQRISSLFFYPEIDQALLEDHAKETAELKVLTAYPRNNTKENLVSAAAKHMYIVFSTYPELTTQFNQDDLTKAFVNHVVSQRYEVKNPLNKRKNTEKDCGWPSFNNPENSGKISSAVVDDLYQLQQNTGQNLYSKTPSFASVQSSKNPSSHTSSRGDSGTEEKRSGTSEGEEESSSRIRIEELQRQVVSGISDDDFMKELERRMGEELTNKTLLQEVQKEIEDNKIWIRMSC